MADGLPQAWYAPYVQSMYAVCFEPSCTEACATMGIDRLESLNVALLTGPVRVGRKRSFVAQGIIMPAVNIIMTTTYITRQINTSTAIKYQGGFRFHSFIICDLFYEAVDIIVVVVVVVVIVVIVIFFAVDGNNVAFFSFLS